MAGACRSWWRNCAMETDSEILDIDRREDDIAPLAANVSKIRELISSLELCHHKADRWVSNIIEAIGTGETKKGLGTRPPGQWHPVEQVWQKVCGTLSAWCAGCPSESLDWHVGAIPASQLLAHIGQRSPLAEWQIHRVIERVRSWIHWPQLDDDPATRYVWLLYGGGEYESGYRDRCPERYQEHEDFWLTTVRTIIHDTVDGCASELSLGLAIDMLWPCHWAFLENLQIVLEAIGGNLHPARPFAACGRNITRLPNRPRMETVANTRSVFSSDSDSNREADTQVLALLGEPTEAKRWLAASLAKTIRLQVSPPAELQALSALAGPAWIKE